MENYEMVVCLWVSERITDSPMSASALESNNSSLLHHRVQHAYKAICCQRYFKRSTIQEVNYSHNPLKIVFLLIDISHPTKTVRRSFKSPIKTVFEPDSQYTGNRLQYLIPRYYSKLNRENNIRLNLTDMRFKRYVCFF